MILKHELDIRWSNL